MHVRYPQVLRLIVPVVLAAAAVADLPAQTRILFPARPVYVEFRALGPDGSPVPDLQASDVVLKVGGKLREIRALEFVRFDADDSGQASASALPAPFATNSLATQPREILLVLEDDAMAPGTEKPVRNVVEQFLQNLSPADRVGIVNIPTARANVPLTTDRAAIRSSLADLIGLSTRGQTDSDYRCRTLLTIESMRNLLLAIRRGPSTTVVFFSAGLTLPETVAPQRLGQPTETCIVRTNHYSDFERVATLSGVNFYAVHVYDDSATAQPAVVNDLLAGLEVLTGAANGDMIRMTADVGDKVARAVRETTAFYRAAFEPDPSERNDLTHRLEVSVARPGVTVRARSAIPIDKADTRAGSGKKLSVPDLLRVGDIRRDLPLRAAAFPSRGDTMETVKLVVVFEAGDASPLASAAVAVYDEKGRLTSQATLRKDDLGLAPSFTAVSVAPGSYRLRVAAEDRSGRVGTLDVPVEAKLTDAAPLTMSALILGTRSGGRFVPKLVFGEGPALVAYLEIYGVPKAVELSVAVELAETLDGPAIGAVPATVQLGNTEGTWQAQAGIALSEVPPGDYVLRALVVIDGELVGRTTRAMRKER